MKVIVIKEFVFDTSDFYRIAFQKGSIIEYSRYDTPSDKIDGTFDHRIRIDSGDNTYFGEDFDIETYTEEFKGLEDYPVETLVKNTSDYIKQMCEDNRMFKMGYELGKQGINKHVRIERCEGIFNANKLMSKINRDDIIDVKPMDNNTYLIVYVKEDEK